MTQPKLKLILDYEVYYGTKPPQNRLSLVKGISRSAILVELSALNYRLKPKNQVHIDISYETQLRELHRFCMTADQYNAHLDIINFHINRNQDYPLLFTRQACLFAMEEILNSNELQNIDNFTMGRPERWDALMKYILAVNYEIVQVKKLEQKNNLGYESLSPMLMPLNELGLETNPIYTFYRAYRLLDYFSNHEIFGNLVNGYFIEKYGIEPLHFLYHIVSMYLNNENANPELNFFYQVSPDKRDLFDRLSAPNPNSDIIKLLTVRKSPFVKHTEGKYLITDNIFLAEKGYNQFLNDFWFDYVSKQLDENGKPKYSIASYRSAFGYFFERHVSDTLSNMYKPHMEQIALLMFNDLEINKPGGKIEVADIYLRKNNQILLGQVKSAPIYDKAKYGGDLDTLYQNDRNKFYENFGVRQLVKSIQNIDLHINELDSQFNKDNKYVVYPCLIINDKALQTALMPTVFNKRFNELLLEENVKYEYLTIMPLNIIAIGDLEKIEDGTANDPDIIWKILEANSKDSTFIPPFYYETNYHIQGSNYPERIIVPFNYLIEKYQKKATN